MALPEDILQLVFDELYFQVTSRTPSEMHSGARLALGTCTSVSKQFRHYSLSRLFRHITLSNEHLSGREGYQLSLLRQILAPPQDTKLDKVGPYIRELIVYIVEMPGFLSPWTSLKDLTLFVDNPDLAYVIDTLHQEGCCLQRFEFLICGHDNHFAVRWTELKSDLRIALQYLVRSPHLESLRIRNVLFLPSYFLLESKATQLDVQQVNYFWGEHDWLASLSQANSRILECSAPVKIFVTNHSVRYRDPTASFHNLTTLKATSWTQGDYLTTSEIIKASAGSLEDLDLTLRPSFSLLEAQLFKIDIAPNLKSFSRKITGTIENDLTYVAEENPNIRLTHQFLNFNNQLSRLWLGFEFFGLMVQEDFIASHLDPHWTDLDELLASAKYKTLERLHISFDVTVVSNVVFDSDVFVVTTREAMISRFPWMKKLEKIDIFLNVVDESQ